MAPKAKACKRLIRSCIIGIAPGSANPATGPPRRVPALYHRTGTKAGRSGRRTRCSRPARIASSAPEAPTTPRRTKKRGRRKGPPHRRRQSDARFVGIPVRACRAVHRGPVPRGRAVTTVSATSSASPLATSCRSTSGTFIPARSARPGLFHRLVQHRRRGGRFTERATPPSLTTGAASPTAASRPSISGTLMPF